MMKYLVIVVVVCLSVACAEDVKPVKAIAVLGFSNKVFGSE